MRVLVTRPQPGADETARRLTERGHEPVVLPLTRTVPLDIAPPALDGVEAVVATSAAAIRHAPVWLIGRISGLPLHAVGKRTAEVAGEAGFGDIRQTFPDARRMAAGLPAKLPAGTRLLYLAGRVRTGVIEDRLAAAGLRVDLVEIYDTVPHETALDAAAGVIGARPLDVALVHSAHGAELLSRLAARPDLAAAFEDTRCLCISARVADALKGRIAARAQAAEAPDEAALLRLLDAEG